MIYILAISLLEGKSLKKKKPNDITQCLIKKLKKKQKMNHRCNF